MGGGKNKGLKGEERNKKDFHSFFSYTSMRYVGEKLSRGLEKAESLGEPGLIGSMKAKVGKKKY